MTDLRFDVQLRRALRSLPRSSRRRLLAVGPYATIDEAPEVVTRHGLELTFDPIREWLATHEGTADEHTMHFARSLLRDFGVVEEEGEEEEER